MNKSTLLVGAAIGYVLGAKAGRERYEQIKDAAGRASRNPRVQSVVDDAKAGAASAAHQAKDSVGQKVSDAVHRDSSTTDPDTGNEVPPMGSTS